MGPIHQQNLVSTRLATFTENKLYTRASSYPLNVFHGIYQVTLPHNPLCAMEMHFELRSKVGQLQAALFHLPTNDRLIHRIREHLLRARHRLLFCLLCDKLSTVGYLSQFQPTETVGP